MIERWTIYMKRGGGEGEELAFEIFFMQIVNVMIVFFSWLGARVWILEFWDLGVESKGKATLKVTILF